MADDDEVRRQQEINMFAAMAQGDLSEFSSATFDATAFADDALDFNSSDDFARNVLSQASGGADPTGTFNLQEDDTNAPSSLVAKNHNLEAAAAALADGDDAGSHAATPGRPRPGQPLYAAQNQPQTRSDKFPKLAPRTPMHTQQVYLPKPLFFGCQLPPRVIEEARSIVQGCPKGQPYPPEVRNLLSTIQTYGHGFDLLQQDSKPTPYVSIYCPKWSQRTSPQTESDEIFASNDPQSNSSASETSVTPKVDNPMLTPTKTGAGQSSAEESNSKPRSASDTTSNMSDRELFSMWANGSDGVSSPGVDIGPESASLQREHSGGSLSTSFRRGSGSDGGVMDDRDLFSQWARGESSGSTRQLLGNNNGNSMVRDGKFANNSGTRNTKEAPQKPGMVKLPSSGTFKNLPPKDDSDDDEVVVSELKKKVGINEHLNAALAYLDDDQNDARNQGENVTGEESTNLLAQLPLTPDGGRPLTNHELMNGVAPLFGHDDSPLPTEADLGIHETRDEQQRSRDERWNQSIIENCCPQNIFGTISCPDPSLHPHDNHSWNSRATAPTPPKIHSSSDGHSIGVPRTVAHAKLGVLPTPEVPGKSTVGSRSNTKSSSASVASNVPSSGASVASKAPHLADKRFDPRQRYGWWHVPDDVEPSSQFTHTTKVDLGDRDEIADGTDPQETSEDHPPLHIPPLSHPAVNVLLQTNLEPNPEKLHEQNRPLSQLHPATVYAHSLPFLSDRPPSYRYLQIDTQAVGFLGVGGEIEPLFCSLAIYHVETLAPNSTKDPTLAPIPDLPRCGKVTETLTFDVVSEPTIESRCHGALWPYPVESDDDKLQGTRCGVFPLPSNLNIYNLYAILIVHKVVSEGSDFEAYLRPLQPDDSGSTDVPFDLASLRRRAEKSAKQHGKFIMPFAFGVAPLLQVFGADAPVVPSSRAVQIPLFRFVAGLGERQIIDHIMVMLYPRADHQASGINGPAPITNRGTAMLVMRNFGYLGLHSVVHSKSSLARDRLVSFTRDMQLRRREESDVDEYSTPERPKNDPDVLIVPLWQKSFVAEPTAGGGRSRQEALNINDADIQTKSRSPLYAQELAPLRLNASSAFRNSTTAVLKSQRSRGHHVSGDDIEPYFHTSFCNDILCQPRILHNCPKGNIVIKVEMREIEWIPKYETFVAHLPAGGPSVHNPRRGPYLVQGAYSSCSARCSDPHFLDEFKMKLPLILQRENDVRRKVSIFFTIYRLSFSPRKKWTKLFRNKKTGKKYDEIVGEIATDNTTDFDASGSCHLIQLACGYLPLVANSTIIVDGSHEVKMSQIAREPKRDIVKRGELDATTLILADNQRVDEVMKGDDLAADDTDSLASGKFTGDNVSTTSASESVGPTEGVEGSRSKGKSKAATDPICLQIRIAVHSSVHSQNSVLNDFFGQEPDVSHSILRNRKDLLKLSREEIYQKYFSSGRPLGFNSDHENAKLLTSVVDLTTVSMCPVPEICEHFIRVVRNLWKVIVCGTDETDIRWANPAALFPLRVQGFATLLQLLGSSTSFAAKRGLTQLDGSTKWNMIGLGRILGLAFDEGDLFGDSAAESLAPEAFRIPNVRANSRAPLSKEKRRRHVRSNFEFLNNGAARDNSQNLRNMSEGQEILGALRTPDVSLFPSIAYLPDESSTKPQAWPVKVDSVTDFRSALKAGSEAVEDDGLLYDGSSTGSPAALAMVKAYSGPQAMSRRWMTAPSAGLATIREDGDDDGDSMIGVLLNEIPKSRKDMGPLDSLDADRIVKASTSSVKQMRVPKIKRKENDEESTAKKGDAQEIAPGPIAPLDSDIRSAMASMPRQRSQSESWAPPPHGEVFNKTVPSTDAEIEMAGSSFLDAVEMSLGLGRLIDKGTSTGEEDDVGQAHHKKTTSHCSIDWSIPNDDIGRFAFDSSGVSVSANPLQGPRNEFDDTMTTLAKEQEISFKLPSFLERLMVARKNSAGRWFPFVYEIIIMQWAAILDEQRTKEAENTNTGYPQDFAGGGEKQLADAASRASGVAIACAPVLFETIKQSLGWRIANIHQRILADMAISKFHPLVILDDSLMANLERIVEYVTLACIDFRNFDAWETRQTCIDVNDSLVWFLRDLFAYLDPKCAHRLMMIYLTRLLGVNGKLPDRDSNTGLRCSWEVTKLQLNAISALVRFPDFMKVNSPQFSSLGESLFRSSGFSAVALFDDLLDFYGKLNAPFVTNNDVVSATAPNLFAMRPHWLAEIVVDVCILGTEHAEQNIQRRASSLLLEMFWGQSQAAMVEGNSSIVASMYVTFLEKVICRANYIARCFSAKSQVRQDILRAVVFVLQSAPGGLLRALWRKLCAKSSGKGFSEKYGAVGASNQSDATDDGLHDSHRKLSRAGNEWQQEPDIFEMFNLINLSLATFEYEGTDEHAEAESPSDDDDGPYLPIWKREFLLSREHETQDRAKRRRLISAFGRIDVQEKDGVEYATTSSRRWHSHDGSIVLIKTTQQIVRELRIVLEPSEEAQSFFNPARQKLTVRSQQKHKSTPLKKGVKPIANGVFSFTYVDTVIFVRAATSVYLHALTLQQSDITLVKAFNASLEIVKIFGIKIFNEAVGETLQHWMRVVSFHCGSRRAEVRVQASDFLEFILRSTWDTFGSFFRIRLPLLAVQTEVMERIVATAAARHYREQRMMSLGVDLFSNGSAEASLAPLWRTLDRLHHQSASQNVAFRSALMRLAEKVKKLFRAYVAAHALSFLHQAKPQEDIDQFSEAPSDMEAQTVIRASRISVHRVINASAGYSKQFLGFYSTSLDHTTVAHNEAVEDAFLAAADVFSPTELPDHRVAWLRRLAKFHSVRHKYAEEATCHYNIHITLQQASSLHGALWFSTPFLPWTNTKLDGMHLDGEGPAGDPDDTDFEDIYDNNFGRQLEKTNSFRRIFYRNENSIRVNGGELEGGTSKYAFYGVTLPSEYSTISPWTTMREMEASMLEEAEAAGDLFLKAGIIASSRYAWSLAVRHYAEKFSYGKLKHVYERLGNTVVSEIPPLDSNQQEISVTVPLGRFYRVWFHGGAPDELIGAEFVYRTASHVKLEQFGKELKEVIRCIIPDKTPIHLVLDGRAEEREPQTYSGFRMGVQLEPVRVKVTPLRCLVTKTSRMRGLPEWFQDYFETAFHGQSTRDSNSKAFKRSSSMYSDGSVNDVISRPRHRDHDSTYSASVFSSSGNSVVGSRRPGYGTVRDEARRFRQEAYEGELVGADKFSFMQPINKGRDRGTRDWLKGSSGDFASKTLRVTQLQVAQSFPACVSRQAVVHRVVFTQSPLEAAIDSLCQWCAILFRTAVATNGQAALGINYDPGIGIDAAKVVSDSIHSSRVKEMGLYLLKKNTDFAEEEEGDPLHRYDRLSEDVVKKLQLKLARALVVFMELLHLMVARNRELLLEVIQERKRSGETSSRHSHTASNVSLSDARSTRSVGTRQGSTANGNDSFPDLKRDDSNRPYHRKKESSSQGFSSLGNDDCSVASAATTEKSRTDSAIGIQSELQRAFISLAKELHPKILGIMGSETPRWLKQCSMDNYFSAYTYRNVKIPIEEELTFDDLDTSSEILGRPTASTRSHSSQEGTGIIPIPVADRSFGGPMNPGSPGGSLGSASVASTGKSSDAGRSNTRSIKSYERGPDRFMGVHDSNIHRMSSL